MDYKYLRKHLPICAEDAEEAEAQTVEEPAPTEVNAPARKRGRTAKKAAAAAEEDAPATVHNAETAVADDAAEEPVADTGKATRGGGRKRAKAAEADAGAVSHANSLMCVPASMHQCTPDRKSSIISSDCCANKISLIISLDMLKFMC